MTEIPSQYSPSEVERKWVAFWKRHHFFKADPNSKKPSFSIVMPPPNVTGILHMGHVLGNTIQDILSRFKRMQGFEVLWLPGTDHAGIATQTVVERDLIKRTGQRRKEVSREAFEDLCHTWAQKHKDTILEQIERLGCSCDFSRIKFTMDKDVNQSVLKLFKKLFDEKLIYQGYYLVNWDPVTQTALADDEVEFEERHDFLYHINYPIKGSDEFITIATTRPETLLGDTAVAVSPKDTKHASFVGQTITLPLTNREIPIITDHYVDPEFGTGAVKITPAHDFNDYEVGKRHDLTMINILTPDGKINQNGGKFEGLNIKEAREKVLQELKKLNLLLDSEPYTHRVGISYRSKAVIEPYLSKQWFINMKPFAAKLKSFVKEKKVELIPENWENTYFHWIDNLRDWCISRQLWWGHQIPIWYHLEEPDKIICHIEEGLPEEVKKDPEMWRRDEDVLDTWFSSALWPFSTLGWPQKTRDLEKFYPNSILVTGHDILFFWVTRMLMMGEYTLGELPFSKVILTGLIYGKSYWRKSQSGTIQYAPPQERLSYDMGKQPPKDVYSKWEKISKSKGNAIDPLEIIELYGTCAMRMALASTSCQLRQIDLDRRRFEEFKNFANKVWNGARFVFSHLSSLSHNALEKGLKLDKLSLEDKWILFKLNETIHKVTDAIETYQFDVAAQRAYNFYWNEFCAYYVEIAKPLLFEKRGSSLQKEQTQIILFIVLNASLRLLHPMAPFITEELFERLKQMFSEVSLDHVPDAFTHEAITALKAPCCALAPFPRFIDDKPFFEDIEKPFSSLQKLIYHIRNIRGEMKLPPSVKTDIYIQSSKIDWIERHQNILEALLPTKKIFFNKPCEESFTSEGHFETTTLTLPLPPELLLKEKKRLEKEYEKRQISIHTLKQKLANRDFIEKAPKELVEKQKKLLSDQQAELKKIHEKLSAL